MLVYDVHRIFQQTENGSKTGVQILTNGERSLKNKLELILSDIKAPSSLGIGERVHEPLRRIFKKLEMDFEKANSSLFLR